jgi:hypothetical protein
MGLFSKVLRVSGLLIATAVVVIACTVSLPDDGKYKCASDADCGGGGFICFQSSFCCKPGDEGCIPAGGGGGSAGAEVCNGADDDGDGEIDEGFNKQNDRNNCGQCNNVCSQAQVCTAGACAAPGETLCNDGADNDGDTLIDCADSDCNGASCGTGCACGGGTKTETLCTLGNDEDGDGQSDCADSDCNLLSCGQGCTCFGLAKTESGCADGLDNDGDSKIDCNDVETDGSGDCPSGRACKAAPNTSACSGNQCQCNGVVSPATETRCGDGVDNDCSGSADCADLNCNTLGCQADGGRLCFCRGLAKAENANLGACENLLDDDGDGKIDCAEGLPDGGGDCPWAAIFPDGGSIRCKKTPGGQLGQCKSDLTCQ